MGSAQAMTGPSDISTLGAYVDATNFIGSNTPAANTGHLSIDGITFNAITAEDYGAGAQTDSGGDISFSYAASIYYGAGTFTGTYASALSTLDFGGGKVTLDNLTIGDSYQVQVWAFDPNNSIAQTTTTLGGATPGTLADVPAGQTILGTFTATGSTETFTLGAPSGGWAIVNGVALEDTTLDVPEPATYGMLMGGVGMLLAVQRSRRRGNKI